MGYYEQEHKRRPLFGQENNTLVVLLAGNLIIFCILAFIKAIYFVNNGTEGGIALYHKHILQWIALPADPGQLLRRPWTVLTHMFVHDSLGHIIGNMLWLWFFGYILHDLTGNRKIIPVYIYGALAGALAYILAYNFIPAIKPGMPAALALGGSAGIMAIALATTMISPGYRLFPMINGGIPIWVLTMIYVVIDLALIPYGDTGSHIAHLAGALAGFLFIYLLRKGYDGSEWMAGFFEWCSNLFNPDKPKKGKVIKSELFYKSNTSPYTKTPNLTQKRIDEILDKISQQGYHQLTEEEKDLLKRAGEEEL